VIVVDEAVTATVGFKRENGNKRVKEESSES
jgi:hypothetical protein